MKKIFVILLGLMVHVGFAQAIEPMNEEKPSTDGKNMVKINALALSTGTFSVQYEHLLSPKTTIGATINMMPNKGLPFLGSIETLVDDETTMTQLKGVRISSFSVAPEVRFYLGKEGFKGFYIAPFVKYGSYDLEFPLNYDFNESAGDIVMDGKVTSFSGGLAFGAQWKLARKVYLDWMIMGPHYGGAKGTLVGQKPLSQEEQDGINQAIQDLDVPLIEYEYEVNASGAKIKLDSPWVGVRAVIGIGFRF